MIGQSFEDGCQNQARAGGLVSALGSLHVMCSFSYERMATPNWIHYVLPFKTEAMLIVACPCMLSNYDILLFSFIFKYHKVSMLL